MVTEKFLAIDYGTQRLGLALSYGTLAEPLPEISNQDGCLLILLDLVNAHQVTKIVMGLSENQMAEQTKAFAQELAQHVSVPIVFTDETLSSYVSAQQLKQLGKTSPRVRSLLDSRAAANFLQEYLDEQA